MFELHIPDLVIVTGSSSGLGTVIARTCLGSGSRVIGFDLDDPGDRFPEEPGYRHLRGSVTDEGAWAQVGALVDGEEPGVSLGYVACAATQVQGTPSEVTLEGWRRQLEVNIAGPALGLAALTPKMQARGRGAVVMIGSVAAQFGEEALTAYSASKGGLRQLTRSAALDYARLGIRVNMVSPGPMLTEMFFFHASSSADPDEFRAMRERRQPLGEILDPQLIANAVAFLLSDEGAGTTGIDLVVDGGLTAGFEFKNLTVENAVAAGEAR